MDDAVGEALDKTARSLGLQVTENYSYGQLLEILAKDGNRNRFPFTMPLKKRKGSCEFSYSGLKTQIRRFQLLDFFLYFL